MSASAAAETAESARMTASFSTVHATAQSACGIIGQLDGVLAREDLEFSLLLSGPGALEQALLPLSTRFSAQRIFGCTTSGEITPGGYHENSLVCIGFHKQHFTAVSRRIDGLRSFGFQDARNLVLSAQWELRERAPDADAHNSFAILLIDSTSQAEEFVAAALGSELGNTTLIGGSAGDNWKLSRTPVLDGGRLHDDAAVLLLVHTALEFRHYNFHHYRPSSTRGVITSATPAKRLVHEINGTPAIVEYARLCGLDASAIDLEHLSLHPIIILIGDKGYARGFSELLEDGSMRFACAIDEGMVFRVAQPGDFVAQLEERFAALQREIGTPQLVLAFECAARKVDVERNGLYAAVATLFARNNVWGFSCMGEQANAINMNNSFNCLAFSVVP